jgi:hypothetical protein
LGLENACKEHLFSLFSVLRMRQFMEMLFLWNAGGADAGGGGGDGDGQDLPDAQGQPVHLVTTERRLIQRCGVAQW